MSPLHLKTYRAALYLYSEDLRREFGNDMAEAFEEDLCHSGPVHVWCIAVREIFRIGLPGLMENPQVAVPILSGALSMASLTLELSMAFLHPKPGITPGQFVANVILIGCLSAPIGWAVVRWQKKDKLVSLGLAR
jgi:hypothetical protein